MSTQNTPNYMEQGGGKLVIGGELDMLATAVVKAAGTQAASIAAVATAGSATAAANATAINAILVALRNVGIIAPLP